MQTFLPYPSFERSARALDWRRLGKQRVEALQILNALEDPEYGWGDHPAVKMWQGYEPALRQYKRAMILEWIRRGYKNTMEIPPRRIVRLPHWVGTRAFHASHRSNLLRKDPEWYGRFGWSEDFDREYVWPV